MIKQMVPVSIGVAILAGVSGRVIKAKASEGVVPYQGQNTGRYQIYYSPNVRIDTFLLDTGTGAAWQLAKNKDGSDVFQPVFWVRNRATNAPPGRYRIYFSPNVRADTFVLDTQTGIVAVLAEDKDHRAIFQKFSVQGLNGAPFQ